MDIIKEFSSILIDFIKGLFQKIDTVFIVSSVIIIERLKGIIKKDRIKKKKKEIPDVVWFLFAVMAGIIICLLKNIIHGFEGYPIFVLKISWFFKVIAMFIEESIIYSAGSVFLFNIYKLAMKLKEKVAEGRQKK